jgi:cytochrome c oxidase subunit 1
MAVLIRVELATPAGDFVTDETYNKLFTMHGVMMVFFFLIPAIPSVLGNFLVPIMIGAKDLAFPKLNLASWYIYIIGASFTTYSLVTGGLDTGWTFYTPFSTVSSSSNVISAALGVFITGFSSILTGLNFIVTTHRMRAPGMTWFRMPLFMWSMYATSLIMVLGTPVVAITIVLVGRRAALPLRLLRSARRRRPGALPAPVLVLLAPRGLHHGAAGDGRHQRAGGRVLPQAGVRLLVRRVRQPGDRGARLPGLGATTCSWPASRSTRR